MARTSERDGSTAEADAKVAAIATAALRSRQQHRKQHVVSPSDAANELLADRILEALSSGAPLPSPKLALGADFGEADDEECFGATAGVDFINQMRIDRLEASAHGRAALKAMGSCKESDEDEAHWGGPDSELLEAVVTDNCSPRIHVMRARNPFNPVALFTPLTESPLCAVAAKTIQAMRTLSPTLSLTPPQPAKTIQARRTLSLTLSLTPTPTLTRSRTVTLTLTLTLALTLTLTLALP